MQNLTDRIVKLICDSNRLDKPGPRVTAHILGERFEVMTVCKARCSTTLSFSSQDRQRLRAALPDRLTKRMRVWTDEDRALYDGFHIPAGWIDGYTIEEGTVS